MSVITEKPLSDANLSTEATSSICNTQEVGQQSNRFLMIAIALVAIAAVALCFAEVKWGVVTAGILWTFSNPWILGALITLIVVGGAIYLVRRKAKPVEPVPLSAEMIAAQDLAKRFETAVGEFRKYRNGTAPSQGTPGRERWFQAQRTATRHLVSVRMEIIGYAQTREDGEAMDVIKQVTTRCLFTQAELGDLAFYS